VAIGSKASRPTETSSSRSMLRSTIGPLHTPASRWRCHPRLIGIEYNATFPGFARPLADLTDTQAPRFDITQSGGGYPMGNWNEDFDGWYDEMRAFAANNGGQFDLDQKYARRRTAARNAQSMQTAVTDSGGNQISCLFPCHKDPSLLSTAPSRMDSAAIPGRSIATCRSTGA